MIKLKNYWEETSPSVKKLILWLKGIIGMISVSAFIQGDPKFSFWFLIAGGVVDGILQLLPADAEVKPGAKALLFIVGLFMSASMFTGCFSKRSVTEHSVIDTTSVSYKQVDYQYKGAKVTAGLNIDSLYKAALAEKQLEKQDSIDFAKKLAQYVNDSTTAVANHKPLPVKPVDTVIYKKQYVTDPQTKAQLSYWVDQYGKLQVGCESKDQTLQLMVAEVNRLRSEVDKKTTTITVFKVPAWLWYVLAGSVLLNIILIGLRLFKGTLKAV